MTDNKITGTATRLRIRLWSRLQRRDVHWLEIDDHQYDLQTIKVHDGLHGRVLEQIEIARPNIHNLPHDQIRWITAAQTGRQNKVASLNRNVLGNQIQRHIPGDRTT